MDRKDIAANMRDSVHTPQDAGIYEQDLQEILKRIPDGWGRWISCDKGWFKLLAETNDLMKYMHPNYEIYQVKEKFGELRYYFNLPTLETDDEEELKNYEKIYKIMQAIARAAEHKSAHICETCGERGRVRDENWYKTLCYYCAKEQGYQVLESEEKRYGQMN